MTDIEMPRLSDSMQQGTILKWLTADGGSVEDGEELLEIETDKATMTWCTPATGLLQIVVAEGETVPVGTVIARVTEAGGTGQPGPPALVDEPAPPPSLLKEPALMGDPAQQPAPPRALPKLTASPPEAHAEAVPATAQKPSGEARATGGGNQRTATATCTPLARRIALAHGIDIATVAGTGPRGRITRPDVLAAAGLRSAAPVGADRGPLGGRIEQGRDPRAGGEAPIGRAHVDQEPQAPNQLQPSPESQAPPKSQAPTQAHAPAQLPPLRSQRQIVGVGPEQTGGGRFQPFTPVERLIASRMSEVKATVPEFEITAEVRLDEALALRASLKAVCGDEQCPSLNDFVVKACALALRAHPRVNASFAEGGLLHHEAINVGIAVSADDALLVPTIFDADLKSLGAIAQESRSLARRARSGDITPRELEGGTFTVSNLGMFGVSSMTPVLNPGQAAILGVGQSRAVLQRVEGEIVESHLSCLTLTCDHRVIYGAHAARFLNEVKSLLQAPLRLAL